MSDSTEVARFDESTELDGGYKLTRVRMATLLEHYCQDKAAALDLLERWERGTWAGVLVAAPSAMEAKEAFGVAAKAFLSEQG